MMNKRCLLTTLLLASSVVYAGVTNLTSTISISNAIPKGKDTTINGHIKWNEETESFAAHFSIGTLQSDIIALPKELSFTSLGFTLYGPSGSTATISDIMLNYSPELTPEPSPSIMALFSIFLQSHPPSHSRISFRTYCRYFPQLFSSLICNCPKVSFSKFSNKGTFWSKSLLWMIIFSGISGKFFKLGNPNLIAL